MRFHREVHAGAALHATGSVLNWTADSAELLIVLWHSADRTIAATFRVVAAAVGADDAQQDWRVEVVARAALRTQPVLPEAEARGLSLEADGNAASLSIADALGMQVTGLTTVLADHCDPYGRWRLPAAMGLVADCVPHMRHGTWRDVLAASGTNGPLRVGGALVEFAFIHHRWPRAGDRVAVRSGLAGCTDRVTRSAHWLLDPATGDPWATVRTVGVALDLDARRLIKLTPDAQDAYRSASISTL